MVSSQHEAMHQLLQHHPMVFVDMVDQLDLPLPPPISIELLSTDMTELRPLERHADSALRMRTNEGDYAIVIEAQRDIDDCKPGRWVNHASYAHQKYDLIPLVVVICQDDDTAVWARGPHVVGPDWYPTITLRPLVFGPSNVPIVYKPEDAAANVVLAALSAVVHARSPVIKHILKALAHALKNIDEANAVILSEFVEAGLNGTPAQAIWRNEMTIALSFFKGEIANSLRTAGEMKGRTEGEARGEVKAILLILDSRGVAVSDQARERITSCADIDMLDAWTVLATKVTSTEELFAA